MIERLSLLAALAMSTSAFAAPADVIAKVPTGDDWDKEIKRIVLSMYDADGSGSLDTPSEIGSVECDAWKAMDKGVRGNWEGSGMRVIYGFDAEYIWVGYALGVDESQRVTASSALEGCGVSAERSAPVTPSPSATSVATGGSIAAGIAAVATGDSSTWGDEVEKLLLAAYDSNGSGMLDTLAELGSIDCATWQAMEAGTQANWTGSGVRVIYGFDPDFIWVGSALSIDAPLRTASMTAAAACGIGDAIASPAEAIAGFPEGGSDGWDTFVSKAMVSAYDSDRSGSLDSPSEVRQITCDTWNALDQGVQQGWGSGIRQVYGLHPDLTWVGYAIGLDESMRHPANDSALSCGLEASQDAISGPKGSGGDATAGSDTPIVSTAVGATPAARIASVAGASDWDAQVEQELIGSFDLNRNGKLDSGKELKAVPCTVYSAMDQHVQGAYGGSGLRPIYGFQKGFIWVGYSLGFDEKLRKKADKAMSKCGLE